MMSTLLESSTAWVNANLAAGNTASPRFNANGSPNTACVAYGLTGLGALTDPSLSMKAALISPSIVVFANHYAPSNGQTLTWRLFDGSTLSRTVNNIARIESTDLAVGFLSMPIYTISPIKLLPSDWATGGKIASAGYLLPVFLFTQDGLVRLWNVHSFFDGQLGSGTICPASTESVQPGCDVPAWQPYQVANNLASPPYNSSSPLIGIVGSDAVLLGLASTVDGTAFGAVASYQSDILAAASAAGVADSLAMADLSAYDDDAGPPPAPPGNPASPPIIGGSNMSTQKIVRLDGTGDYTSLDAAIQGIAAIAGDVVLLLAGGGPFPITTAAFGLTGFAFGSLTIRGAVGSRPSADVVADSAVACITSTAAVGTASAGLPPSTVVFDGVQFGSSAAWCQVSISDWAASGTVNVVLQNCAVRWPSGTVTSKHAIGFNLSTYGGSVTITNTVASNAGTASSTNTLFQFTCAEADGETYSPYPVVLQNNSLNVTGWTAGFQFKGSDGTQNWPITATYNAVLGTQGSSLGQGFLFSSCTGTAQTGSGFNFTSDTSAIGPNAATAVATTDAFASSTDLTPKSGASPLKIYGSAVVATPDLLGAPRYARYVDAGAIQVTITDAAVQLTADFAKISIPAADQILTGVTAHGIDSSGNQTTVAGTAEAGTTSTLFGPQTGNVLMLQTLAVWNANGTVTAYLAEHGYTVGNATAASLINGGYAVAH